MVALEVAFHQYFFAGGEVSDGSLLLQAAESDSESGLTPAFHSRIPFRSVRQSLTDGMTV
jgi:hypothetical protein